MRRPVGGIRLRIGLAAAAVAGVAIVIIGAGVIVIGAGTFADMMAGHGQDQAASHAMFDDAVVRVVLAAALVAGVVATVLASLLGPTLARPLERMSVAARRIAGGDYATRVEPEGPPEILSLAESLNQMAAALEEQERLRRDLVANAAHELRTPLTNLKGYLEALRDGVIEPDRATFESLWEETERLVRLSRSLEALEADAAEPSAVPIDLARGVRSAVELADPAFRAAGLRVVVEVPPALPARGDPDRLAQILGNLLQNALRYTPAGGTVTVHADRRADDVVVAVSNTGPGIPAEDLPHVFERFYRVEKSRDRARGGAGIGLAIVREHVEALGGRVGAESGGEQTRIWFTVPA
jgi:two-component system sensor histidine kinase BaeS